MNVARARCKEILDGNDLSLGCTGIAASVSKQQQVPLAVNSLSLFTGALSDQLSGLGQWWRSLWQVICGRVSRQRQVLTMASA